MSQHRLGVELHSLEGKASVAHRHHHVTDARADLELGPECRLVDGEGVVSTHDERARETGEDSPPIVLDQARSTVS